MIYCLLKGGLGNMMFQVAACTSISLKYNTEITFPNLESHLTYLDNDNYYNPKLKYSQEYKKIFKDLTSFQPKIGTKIINVPFEFSEILIKNDEDTLIDGFFQSEKYFIQHRNEILELFEMDTSILNHIKSKYSKILDKKTTSIHVRRGDYLNHPNHHPTQDLEYYLKSIDILNNETELFVIFSDDIKWCKENIKLDNAVYIEDEKDYIELYLMSICTNNIISNSSFSWWGAWLNKNINKKVIGPINWFGNLINHNTSDLLPEKWIKI